MSRFDFPADAAAIKFENLQLPKSCSLQLLHILKFDTGAQLRGDATLRLIQNSYKPQFMQKFYKKKY